MNIPCVVVLCHNLQYFLYLWYLGRATMASFFSIVNLEVAFEPLKHHRVGGCITLPHVSDTCLVNLKVLCSLIFPLTVFS